MKQPHGKENRKLVASLYGVDEYGFSIIPGKAGTRWMYRWIGAHHQPHVCCVFCYMGRRELHKHPDKRSWKRNRRYQCK